MSTKRVSLFTVRSLTVLCKGCPSCRILDYTVSHNRLKTISTAAERFDVQYADGYLQNPGGLQCVSPNSQWLPNGQSPDDVVKANANGLYRGSSMDNRQSSNEEWGYVQGNEFVNKSAEKGGAFNGPYQKSYVISENISCGFDQTPDRGHVNSCRNVFQNKSVSNENTAGYDQSTAEKLQNINGVCVDNSRGFGQPLNASFENQNGFYAQHSRGTQHKPYGFVGNLPSSNGFWTEGPKERMQYPNAYSSPGLSMSQRNPKGNFTQNAGWLHQVPNDHYAESNESYQHNLVSGQFQHNPTVDQYPPNINTVQNSVLGSHLSNNAGNFTQNNGWLQQMPNGQYTPNLNTIQNSVLGNAKTDEGSAETSDAGQYEGTLEELDNFCREGEVKKAVEVLGLLEKRGIQVDLPRYLKLMHQCGEAKSLEEAKTVHKHVLQYMSPLKVSTNNKILDMYSKCGSMDEAVMVFNNMPERNLTTWDTLITWLAKNGLAEDAIDLFTQFKKLGLKPDGQMFIGVFAACSMLGDIDEGMLHFESMSKDYGIVPSMAHYISVVDMFGSIGHLDEAFEFIGKMPLEPSADVWETLMNLCRVHGHMELGDRCAELVEHLDPFRLNEQSKAGLVPVKASDLEKEKEKKKLTSQNLLEVRSRVHEYRAGDTSHPENDKIYALLRGLKSQMKESGYIPETRFVLHDIDQESKEEALLAHSERLAVAYGLLSSSVRSPIRVIKNLRFCGDCHNALKIISELVGRELIIRDAKRFHHFKDGVCSCRDYW